MVNFEVFGRKVDLKKEYLKFYVCYLVCLVISIGGFISIPAYVLSGGFLTDNFLTTFTLFAKGVESIFSLFTQSGLLDALLIILFAKFWGIKKDLNFARAIATSHFLVLIAFALLNVILTFNIIPTYYYNYFATLGAANFLFSLISSFASIALGSIQLYLSLILFLEWNKIKLKNSFLPALIFGIISFLLMLILPFLLRYNEGQPFALDLILSLESIFSSSLFGFVILYSIKKKSIDRNIQYLFAILYVGSPLFYQLALNSNIVALINLGLLNPFISLALIYLIDKSSFFDSFADSTTKKL